MKGKEGRFSLRTSRENLDKLNYIAEYNGRSGNKELEQMLRRYIDAFEKKHGKIMAEDMNR